MLWPLDYQFSLKYFKQTGNVKLTHHCDSCELRAGIDLSNGMPSIAGTTRLRIHTSAGDRPFMLCEVCIIEQPWKTHGGLWSGL